jgi:hypothetical protein
LNGRLLPVNINFAGIAPWSRRKLTLNFNQMENTFCHSSEFYAFIKDCVYAKEQIRAWRSMGYTVKPKRFTQGIELTIKKKLYL